MVRRPTAFPPELNSWDRLRSRDLDRLTEYGLEYLGALVRRDRLAAGLSQRELARRSGVSQSTISRLERAQLICLRLVKLARILGVLDDPRLGRPVPDGYLNRWS